MEEACEYKVSWMSYFSFSQNEKLVQRKWRETTHVIVEDVKKKSTSLTKNWDKGDTFEDYYT
ncbi:hypothetical protein MTR_8g015730 [Medicago truncatula]|uniref:Uncharacterized protein n=1 Tax=Medicago truncatula TaxID=3880 RepID=G8A2S5_MEDTR|nr:hypothetical protein MTR_8g015730 [Medicago truncatula]